MKQQKINDAFVTLRQISTIKIGAKEAYELYKLMHALKPSVEFAVQRENDLMKKYNGKPEGNNISFACGDSDEEKQLALRNMRGFQKEVDELYDMDNEIEYTPVKLSFSALGDFKISPNDIIALEGFVEFVE